MSEYRRGTHTVFRIHVHLVWCTKYRKGVLSGDIGHRLKDVARQICTGLPGNHVLLNGCFPLGPNREGDHIDHHRRRGAHHGKIIRRSRCRGDESGFPRQSSGGRPASSDRCEHLTLDRLLDAGDQALPPELQLRERPIITACEGGPMGALAAHALKQRGFINVAFIDGGTRGWLGARLPTTR